MTKPPLPLATAERSMAARRKVDGRAAGLAENDIATPGRAACRGVAGPRPDDQVGQAVAIDVAGRGDTKAAAVTRTLSVDHEAAVAIGDCREVDGRAAGLAEDDIAAPGIAASRGVAVGRSDDQVGQAVAIDVAGRGHTIAAEVKRTLTVDDEAAVAIG